MKINYVPQSLMAQAYKSLMVGTIAEAAGVPDDILLVETDEGKAVAFVGVKNIDRNQAYLKYGEATKPMRGTALTGRALVKITEAMHSKYRYLYMIVKNTNAPMIRIAIKAGWLIHGYHQALNGEGFVDLMSAR